MPSATASGPGALSTMELSIAFVVTFSLGFGAGYVVGGRKRLRSRWYYHGD